MTTTKSDYIANLPKIAITDGYYKVIVDQKEIGMFDTEEKALKAYKETDRYNKRHNIKVMLIDKEKKIYRILN